LIKKLTFSLLFLLILSSCSSSRKISSAAKFKRNKAEKIVANALKYKGVKYKYGGTTRKGMDCSGIVFVAFGKEKIKLPRVSKNMAKTGKKVSLKKAKKGDLIFFKTRKRYANINHVGLIVSAKNGQIRFIHSTTSKGVIISSLSQKYWRKAFVKINRVL
jgi:probable lipoprotein NlpC